MPKKGYSPFKALTPAEQKKVFAAVERQGMVTLTNLENKAAEMYPKK